MTPKALSRETVPVEHLYNKDGYLLQMKINGHVIDIPNQEHPMVSVLIKDAEWIQEKFYLTPEEIKQKYGDLLTKENK